MLQTLLGASVGALLKATVGHQEALVVSKEGWALRAVSDKQHSYLMAKFRTGQTTGRKLDAEMVAREMRRAQDPYNVRLFQVLVFGAGRIVKFL